MNGNGQYATKQTTIWFANALNWLVTDTIRIFVLLTDLRQNTVVLSLDGGYGRQVVTDLFQFDDIHVTDHDILFSPNFLTIQLGDLDWSLQWLEVFMDDREVLGILGGEFQWCIQLHLIDAGCHHVTQCHVRIELLLFESFRALVS